MQPTRSLYDIRLKCYGSNSDFYVFGEIDIIMPFLFIDNADIIPGYLHVRFCNNRPIFNEVIV